MVDEAIVTTRMVLVATWRDGLFVVSGETRDQELGTQSVRALAPDGQGGALAIVNGRSLRRRAPDWRMEHHGDHGDGSRVLRGGRRR